MTQFIVNPQSRSGKGTEIWEEVEKHLIQKSIPYQLHMTACAGDAVNLARKISQQANSSDRPINVVGLGGDGTLCEVLNGLTISDRIRLGYIPTGSGNDFGRSMHYPSNLRTIVERITDEPETEQIDFGVMKLGSKPWEEHRFAVSCGIGFDAAVCHNLFYTKIKKALNAIHLGKLSYIVIGLKQLAQLKTSDGFMIVDGKKIELEKVSFISCHVQPYEGGGFRFAPKANCRDGLLEICVMSGKRLDLIPVLLKALLRKPINSAHVKYYSCKTAQIHLDRPSRVHTDGEIYELQTDITVSDSGQKINLIKV